MALKIKIENKYWKNELTMKKRENTEIDVIYIYTIYIYSDRLFGISLYSIRKDCLPSSTICSQKLDT